MFIVYDIVFGLFVAGYFPILLLRRKWHRGFGTRFGVFSPAALARLSGRKNIWVHAVSVGEVLAVEGLIDGIKRSFPWHQIVCTTVTATGQQVARERLGKDVVALYAPLDFSWVVRKYLDVIRPAFYVAAETEIWPNIYTALEKRKVPVIQVNGRISDRSFDGYRRTRFLLKRVLRTVACFCMQSETDASRIRELGAPASRVYVVGNLKFDNVPAEEDTLRGLDKLGNDTVFIAGSTHSGEETIVLDVYKEVSKEFFPLRLVIAPRHVERTQEVLSIVREKGFKGVKFSELDARGAPEGAVIVVDSIGILRHLYAAAKVVFVGKSLVGQGGQNIIEPAFFGRPIIVGPHMQNFKDIINAFAGRKAVIQVADAKEFTARVLALLQHPQEALAYGTAARQVIQENAGATQRTLEMIKRYAVTDR